MRLIDADALERAVMFLGEDSICNDCAYEFVNLIDEQPTIEAEPVRRGKWEPVPGQRDLLDFRCSACHRYRFHNGEMRYKYKYCPNCGARMEAEG